MQSTNESGFKKVSHQHGETEWRRGDRSIPGARVQGFPLIRQAKPPTFRHDAHVIADGCGATCTASSNTSTDALAADMFV
jgi:hypothetical protein